MIGVHGLDFDELACVAFRQHKGCMQTPRTAVTAIAFDRITRLIGLDGGELKVLAKRMLSTCGSELEDRVKLRINFERGIVCIHSD